MGDAIRKYKGTLIILALILFVLTFFTYQYASVSGVFSDLRNDLKEVEPDALNAYQDLDGNPISLSDFKGTVLVVNSWATWSPYSKDELFTLSALQKQYGNKITVLAINRKEDLTKIRAYLRTYNLEKDDLTYLHDPSDHFYSASGGYAMPETIIYKKDGTTEVHIRGTIKMDEIVARLNAMIQ